MSTTQGAKFIAISSSERALLIERMRPRAVSVDELDAVDGFVHHRFATERFARRWTYVTAMGFDHRGLRAAGARSCRARSHRRNGDQRRARRAGRGRAWGRSRARSRTSGPLVERARVGARARNTRRGKRPTWASVVECVIRALESAHQCDRCREPSGFFRCFFFSV
jgi:hypothetical protein